VTVGYAANKDSLRRRLHRIEGQVRGVERMIDDERYCIDILTQIGAVSSALDRVAFEILDDHVRHCVTDALRSGDEVEAAGKTEELLAAVRRFAKALT
jgi:DNA-binding FrmR family transcriptional regulator